MLSRRDFLKLSGAGMLALALPEVQMYPVRAAGVFQGRVAWSYVNLYPTPALGYRVGYFRRDTILEVAEEVIGGEEGDHNRVWYRIGRMGYVYSGGVQPVKTIIQKAVLDLPETGVVGELTVPYAASSWAINRSPFPGPRLYYASTHWIEGSITDERDGSLWYRAYDHHYDAYYYVRPEFVRILPDEELAPLSTEVPVGDKSLVVHLGAQMVWAYEGTQRVQGFRAATGKGEFNTPAGIFTTFHKRPTAHMVGGDGITTFYDLAGVPWDTYINEAGVALHGTYWHNDFGQPRSHGCINLTPQDAKWIYRWTLPFVPSGERSIYEPGTGTKVYVLEST